LFYRFEQKTGIKEKPVYDIEAAKTVGWRTRLIAEKGPSQADVFWSGEILQTLDLKEKGVLGKGG
jgi:ABC-type Fe3+ transport system substrate-binding protein